MSSHYRHHSQAFASWSLLIRFWCLVAALATLAGCKVTLIGDYDDATDKGVTDVQQTAELYFQKLIADPNTPYDKSFYQGINARVIVLQTRADALPKYGLITTELTNLKMQFADLQKLDESARRPIGAGLVATAQSGIESSVASILKLEIALKRTGSAP